MSNEKELSKIIRKLQDIEKRILVLEGKKNVNTRVMTKAWYKPKSTIEKIISLIDNGFFNTNRAISEIITELKMKDYHLQASDLTLPLRKIVRKDILKRTKRNADGSPSKNWLYKKG